MLGSGSSSGGGVGNGKVQSRLQCRRAMEDCSKIEEGKENARRPEKHNSDEIK